MKKIISLTLCLMLMLTTGIPVLAANPATDSISSLTEGHTYTDGKVSLPYRIYYPTGYDPEGDTEYPVLLYLHGAGERGTENTRHVDSNDGLLRRLIQSDACVVIAPQCPNNYQWVDTDWGLGSYDSTVRTGSAYLDAAKSLLISEIDKGGIDDARVYVSGISMGGYGTWNLIMNDPDFFAAAIPCCGAGDPNMAAKLVDLPIWAFHGDADGIVPVSGTRDMVAAIKAAGGEKITYTEYPGVGHNSWEKGFAEPELLNWLFAQSNIAAHFEAAMEALGNVTSLEQAEEVEAARAMYDSMTDAQKEETTAWAVRQLNTAEATIKKLEKAAEVESLIAALPAPEELEKDETLADTATQLAAAEAAYAALTASEKELVAADAVQKLTDLRTKVDELSTPEYEMGDVDMSGTIDVADIMKLKALIMADEWSDDELAIGDMDSSESLDVGDIMAVKNAIMSK